jgi:hypothetical protein
MHCVIHRVFIYKNKDIGIFYYLSWMQNVVVVYYYYYYYYYSLQMGLYLVAVVLQYTAHIKNRKWD